MFSQYEPRRSSQVLGRGLSIKGELKQMDCRHSQCWSSEALKEKKPGTDNTPVSEQEKKKQNSSRVLGWEGSKRRAWESPGRGMLCLIMCLASGRQFFKCFWTKK